MTDYFSKMDETYAQKYFPSGSVFESATQTLKKRGIVGILFIGIWVVGAVWGLVWSIGRTMEYIAAGRQDMLGVSLFICGFFALVALGFSVLLFFLIKGSGKKREDYVTSSAKNSKLPESEIEAFERQALASDTYILKLTAGLDRALSNATNKDGLLTREYIYLADPAQTVLRVDALRACCLSDYTYYITTGKRHKKVHNLAIYLLASNGVSVRSDTTEEAGRALMELLRERNSAIDTNDGRVLAEGDVSDYRKRLLEGAAS